MITDWDKIIQEIRQQTDYALRNNVKAKDMGVVAIKIALLVDCNNKPLSWIITDVNSIAPTTRAKVLLELLQ